jgi:hypothetical protein
MPTLVPPGEDPPPILLVRLKPGVVGESRRQVHVVPLSSVTPDTFTAYCGLRLAREDAETLAEPAGMPCYPCLARAPHRAK